VLTLAKTINSNSSTINSYIKTKSLFRGDWYFSRLPFNISDEPLISDFNSIEAKNLESDIKNSSHIKRAVFLFNADKEFIRKYDGVMSASKELNISHNVIKNYALLNKAYKGYIFSYERLI